MHQFLLSVLAHPGLVISLPIPDNSQDGQYRDVLRAWHRALEEWNIAGEPQSGGVLDRLQAARTQLLAVIHAQQDHSADNDPDTPVTPAANPAATATPSPRDMTTPPTRHPYRGAMTSMTNPHTDHRPTAARTPPDPAAEPGHEPAEGGRGSVVISTAARRTIGRGLTQLRRAARMSAASACEAIEIAPQTLWRMETGRLGPKLKRLYITALCAIYGAPREVTEVLLALVDQAKAPVWWRPFADIVPAGTGLLLELEHHARRITTVHPDLIPPLLRAPRYQHTLTPARYPGQDTGRWAEFLGQRHACLPGSADITAILPQTALDILANPGQDPQMQAEQIQHLITLADRASIRIIPRRALRPELIPGPFDLLEFPTHAIEWLTEPPIVHVPGHTTAHYHDLPADIADHRTALTPIHQAALNRNASRQLLSDISDQLSDRGHL